MKLKKLVFAAVLGCSLSAAFASSGNFTLTPQATPNTFSGTFISLSTTPSFTDVWTFPLSFFAVGTSTAISFSTIGSAPTFTSVSLSGGALAGALGFTQDIASPNQFNLTLPFILSPSATPYAITLVGSGGGGGYTGTVNVTAVPEPEGLALALAAVGLLTAGARMKRKA